MWKISPEIGGLEIFARVSSGAGTPLELGNAVWEITNRAGEWTPDPEMKPQVAVAPRHGKIISSFPKPFCLCAKGDGDFD